MNDVAWQDEVGARLRILQIIVGALVVGCAGFLMVTLLADVGEPPENVPMLTYMAVAFVALVLVVRLVIRGVVPAVNRRKILRGTWRLPPQSDPTAAEFLEKTGDAGKLWFAFMVRTIISAALLEGAAFFVLIAYMIECTPISLVVAIVLILGIALQMPTRSGTVAWIERQLQLLEEERQFQGS